MRYTLFAVFVLAPMTIAFAKDEQREALWAAVRNGDLKAIEAALDKGADVNAKSEIGITALWIAASKGKLEVIELLVRRGADVNARDGIWYQTPLSQSLTNLEAVKLLVKAGAKDIDTAFMSAASAGRLPIVQALLDSGKVGKEALAGAISGIPA